MDYMLGIIWNEADVDCCEVALCRVQFLLQSVQSGSSAHPVSYSEVRGIHFHGIEVTGSCDHSPPSCTVVKNGLGRTSAPPCAFLVGYLIKHWNIFIFLILMLCDREVGL
jgi:hypothetical protein